MKKSRHPITQQKKGYNMVQPRNSSFFMEGPTLTAMGFAIPLKYSMWAQSNCRVRSPIHTMWALRLSNLPPDGRVRASSRSNCIASWDVKNSWASFQKTQGRPEDKEDLWDSFMISFLNRCDFLFDPISVSAARMMSFSFLQIDRFTCTSTWHSLKPKEPQDLLVYLVCLTKVVPGWSLSCVFVMSFHTATLLKLECCFQICSGKQHKKTTSYGT